MPKTIRTLKDSPKIKDLLNGGVGGVPPRLLDIEALNSQNIIKKELKTLKYINKNSDKSSE